MLLVSRKAAGQACRLLVFEFHVDPDILCAGYLVQLSVSFGV